MALNQSVCSWRVRQNVKARRHVEVPIVAVDTSVSRVPPEHWWKRCGPRSKGSFRWLAKLQANRYSGESTVCKLRCKARQGEERCAQAAAQVITAGEVIIFLETSTGEAAQSCWHLPAAWSSTLRGLYVMLSALSNCSAEKFEPDHRPEGPTRWAAALGLHQQLDKSCAPQKRSGHQLDGHSVSLSWRKLTLR